MSGRLPERQVKTKASYARTISDKRKTARQAIPPGTLSPEPQTKAAAGEKRVSGAERFISSFIFIQRVLTVLLGCIFFCSFALQM